MLVTMLLFFKYVNNIVESILPYSAKMKNCFEKDFKG